MFKYLALASVASAALLDFCKDKPQCQDKAFGGQIGNTINSMNEYGCWCYFNDDHGRGKGTPVDAIDEMCKTLHEGSTCVPWEVDYTSAVGGSGLTIAEECANVNSDNNCAIRACSVEGSFMANLLDVFISGNGINNDNRHSNGFDQATVCATKKNGGGPSNKACCGNYPDRFPFKTVGGDRQCCGSRTYNSLTLKCCDASASQVKFNC